MKTRVGWWIALGAVLGAAAIIAWWHRGGVGHDDPNRARRIARSHRLDVDGFRAQLAARLERASEIAARKGQVAQAAAATSRRSRGPWPMQGRGPNPGWGTTLTKPCILGPGELCARLADLITSCDAGHARDCMAVGQYLADTPPRPLIASLFFTQACRIGDTEGCERLDDLKGESDVPCDGDPFACAWRAYRAHDEALIAETCSLGVGDSCANMAELTKDDVAQSRAYLESACQLGNPMTCEELARRLSPGCIANEHQVCYPPDPAQASAALAIACSAGLDADVCKQH